VASGARYGSDEVLEEKEEPLLSAYPNPFSHVATFHFTATEKAPSDLAMFDTHGRTIHSLYQGDLPVGESKEIKFETSLLPNGMYVLQLKNGEKTRRLKLIVAK
jgi:hypothetical protein